MPKLSLKVDKGVDVPGPVLREPTMVNSLDKAQTWAFQEDAYIWPLFMNS